MRKPSSTKTSTKTSTGIALQTEEDQISHIISLYLIQNLFLNCSNIDLGVSDGFSMGFSILLIGV